jgi:hypothetical protein
MMGSGLRYSNCFRCGGDGVDYCDEYKSSLDNATQQTPQLPRFQ